MAIDENTEERAAQSRLRQDKRTPFLINEADARLYPNTKLMRQRPGYRLYHGDARASLADRQRYLLGLTARREVAYDPAADQAPAFDLNTAGLDEILSFATEQYGAVLDPNMPIAKLRRRVYELSRLSEEALRAELSGNRASAVDARDPTDASDGTADEPNELAAIAQKVAQAGIPPVLTNAVGGLGGGLGRGQPDPGKPIDTPPALRGGRQPRGETAGKKRSAGVPAAA